MCAGPSLPGGGPAGPAPPVVAGFDVLGELGRGGRTITYRVRRGSSLYALKMLQRGTEPVPERAFRREAALLASVNDPGLVRVHEVGVAHGLPYLVMDFVDGRPLSRLLARGPLPVAQVVQLGIDAANALGAAHRARLVHRDVKPDNILVSGNGHARVIDFGLAVRPGDLDEANTAGTLLYCAPEQAGMLHRPVDGRADLYALGAVLFECATGRPPLHSQDVGELLRLHANQEPADPRASRPDLPPPLAGAILKLLRKDPDDRYQTAAGLVADLRRIAAGDEDFDLGTADQARARPDRPLIGRDTEFDTVLHRWELIRAGRTSERGGRVGGGVILVSGAAGSGKSRLAREAAAAVRRDGGLVLFGECEPEQGVPLGPLRRAVDEYLADISARPEPDRTHALERVRVAAGPTAPLLRGLSPTLDAILLAPGLDDEDRQQQFSVAVASFLAGLAEAAGGALLHLDDVQWLDAGTRRVLTQLAERLPEVPLLILTTARDDAESAPAMALLRAAIGGRFEATLPLRPLPADAVGGLVSGATGGLSVDEPTAASLAARSDGNPFTLLQYLDAALDAGLLRPDWGCWRLDAEDLRTVELGGDGVDLVLGRLDGLDPDSRYVLGVGAVYGSVFDHALIADVCGLPRARLLEISDAAAWRNLVERRPGGRYAFLHDRIREALLAQFDPRALRAVHQRLADRLARLGATDPDTVFALARHSQLGETRHDPDRLYRACFAAGELALAEHAPAEALAYLDRAAQAARDGGFEVDAHFLLALATAQHRYGHFADAIATAWLGYERSTSSIERATILSAAALALGSAWESTEESRVVQLALTELGRPPAEAMPALVVSTLWTFLIGQLSRLTRIGCGTARGADREVLRLEATLNAAGSWAYARQLKQVRSLLATLREMYPVTRIGSGPDEARLRIGLAYLDMAAGLRWLGRRNTVKAVRAAAAVGDPTLSAHVAWVDAFIQYAYGTDQGRALYRVLNEHGAWLEPGLHSDLIFILTWNALQRGEVAEAQRLADRREALTRTIGEVGTEAATRFESGTSVRGIISSLLAWQDRPDEAKVPLAGVPENMVRLHWERLPVCGAAMTVAYEANDLGAAFDRAVDEFDSVQLPTAALTPVGWGFCVIRALGRLDQCRSAVGADRVRRLGQARAAVRQVHAAARTPLIRAQYAVVKASWRQVNGDPRGALRQLAKAEPSLVVVDAPTVAFDVARVRAFALRDLRITGEAGRQARAALAIAHENDWTHRARRTVAEFGLGEAATPSNTTTATSNEAISLGRFRQRLDAIEQLNLAASRVLDPTRLAAIALDETIRILGAERAFLFLAEGEPPHLIPDGGRDAAGHDISELTGYSASTVERVRLTGQPVVITGTEEGAALGAQSVVLHGLRSIMVAPVQLDGRLLGVVYLDSRVAKGIFTPDDVGVLIAITNHIAVALETARAAQLEVAVATANRQRDLAEILRDALAEITGTLQPDPESVLVRLKQTVAGIIGDERAWLLLGAAGDESIRIYSDSSADPSTVEPSGQVARLLDLESTVVGEDPEPRPELLGANEVCWLAAPLRARGEPLGVLLLASRRPQAYDNGRADLATTLVGQAMVAFENARLFARVQQLATTDDLTSIANRRHFFELAARELDRSRHSRRGLIAMMVDIDYFKNINDEYGHQVGDEVIQIVASRLNRFARSYDVLGRYGGEEFALLMPTGHQDPATVAERLRAAISDSPIETRAGVLTVTVSVGAASLRPDDADISTLLGRADWQLYEAKRGGRNRVAAG